MKKGVGIISWIKPLEDDVNEKHRLPAYRVARYRITN
jgi:hypothetical protein